MVRPNLVGAPRDADDVRAVGEIQLMVRLQRLCSTWAKIESRRPRVVDTAQAVKLGQQVADTGILGDGDGPVEVSTSAIKNFGVRLKAYGQTGL